MQALLTLLEGMLTLAMMTLCMFLDSKACSRLEKESNNALVEHDHMVKSSVLKVLLLIPSTARSA